MPIHLMQPRFPLGKIYAIYGVTNQNVSYLIRRHGFAIVTNPHALFCEKLATHKSTPFRVRLSDPDYRDRCRKSFQSINSNTTEP